MRYSYTAAPTLLLIHALVASSASPSTSLPNYQECMSPVAQSFQFCNTSLPRVDRVETLIRSMNLTEKIWSLAPDPSVGNDCYGVTRPIPRLGLGPYMWLTETNSQANSFCLDGRRCATAFPGQLGLASTFNRSVWFSKGDVISTEMRALYNSRGKRRCDVCFVGLTGFGPNINIARDPRFGRTSELPGEDPFLNGEYAVEYVKGMQQVDSNGYVKMLAFLKHFTVYSREVNRGRDNYNISAFNFFDTYLPAYEAGMVRGGASGVMCSYNAENGRPSCANDFILSEVMRKKWKRPDSIVMTDCGAVSNMLHEPANAPSPEHAAAWTIANGTDVEAGTHLWVDYMSSAIKKGLVDEKVIDEAARRVFQAFMKAGRFDHPCQVSWSSIDADSIGSEEHEKVRDDAARQALVLLRNLGGALPLQPGQAIVVVGPQADNGQGYLPDYYGDEVCSQDSGAPYGCIPTIYQSIRQYNVKGQTFLFSGIDETSVNKTEHYDHAIAAVGSLADVVVLSMGISTRSEHEGIDRTDTSLPGLQNQFALDVLSIAAERDIPAILVLTNGGALSIDDLLPPRDYSSVYNADTLSDTHGQPIKLPLCYQSRAASTNTITFPRRYAIVEAYNPSLGLKSVVSALFGIGPTSWGRLVTTMYPKKFAEKHSVDQYDMSAGNGLTYRYHTGNMLAQFGQGLPAEDPSKVQLKCSLEENSAVRHKWKVSCDVSNKENRALSALIMIYARASKEVRSNVPYPVPLRALKAFDRVMVNPGDTKTLSIDIGIKDLMLVNNDGHKEALPGKHFDIIDVWDGWDSFASYVVSLDDESTDILLAY